MKIQDVNRYSRKSGPLKADSTKEGFCHKGGMILLMYTEVKAISNFQYQFI
jgi:hypothetical protein